MGEFPIDGKRLAAARVGGFRMPLLLGLRRLSGLDRLLERLRLSPERLDMRGISRSLGLVGRIAGREFGSG